MMLNRRLVSQSALSALLISACSRSTETVTGGNIAPTISTGGALLSVAPALGGSVASFTVDGFDIFKPMRPDTDNILEVSSFPIVPIVNRIPNGLFELDGREIQLTPNLLDLPDFFHGQGWRSAWTIERHDDAFMLLALEHARGEWPWQYRAEQRFHLRPDGCRFEISVENKDNKRMPAGLGFHPYFPKTEKTRLQADYDGYWETDEMLYPTYKKAGSYRKDWNAGTDLIDDVATDHTHFGFGGRAVITEEGRPTTTMTAPDNCDHMHVYCPPEGDFFCVEPVTDRAAPFREEPRMIKLIEPGETYSIFMDICVS